VAGNWEMCSETKAWSPLLIMNALAQLGSGPFRAILISSPHGLDWRNEPDTIRAGTAQHG
jgi:hypothetical protein